MNLLNYNILHEICEYCDQAHLKKYHYKIHLGTNLIPVSFHQQIVILDLSSSNLTFLPDCIGQLTQLRNLNVWNNQLTSLPDSIGQLTQLQNLYVFNNQLTSLPDSIGLLTQLQKLYVYNNQLTSLPESVRSIKNIRISE